VAKDYPTSKVGFVVLVGLFSQDFGLIGWQLVALGVGFDLLAVVGLIRLTSVEWCVRQV